MAESPTRRPRRRFDDDFKAQAVRLVLDEGKSVGSVARDLDLTETALREWVNRARAERTHGKTGLTTTEREELARLRKENRILREEREILKNEGGSLLRERAAMRFRFIAREKAHHLLGLLCRYLRLTRREFYAWQARPESTRATRDRQLKVLVHASFAASQQRYGSPRVHRDLLAQQERVSRKRVIRLMQEGGLRARRRKRFRCTTMSDHDQPVAANLLDRQFTAAAPSQRWVGDTTEFVIGERVPVACSTFQVPMRSLIWAICSMCSTCSWLGRSSGKKALGCSESPIRHHRASSVGISERSDAGMKRKVPDGSSSNEPRKVPPGARSASFVILPVAR